MRTYACRRHCEEQSDEAIQKRRKKTGLLRFARNDALTQARLGNARKLICCTYAMSILLVT
jgi:hypothetical protein